MLCSFGAQAALQGFERSHLLLVAGRDAFTLRIVEVLALVVGDTVLVALLGQVVEVAQLGLEAHELGCGGAGIHFVFYCLFIIKCFSDICHFLYFKA